MRYFAEATRKPAELNQIISWFEADNKLQKTERNLILICN